MCQLIFDFYEYKAKFPRRSKTVERKMFMSIIENRS